MIIELPRKSQVDTDNIPDDFYQVVQREFAAYTKGTRKEYMYQDKLCFIDRMAEKIHHADASDAVNKLIKDTFAYELDEQGEITDPSTFYSIEFMEDCYQLGQNDHKLYTRCGKSSRENDAIMKVEAIVIKAVMDYE